MERYLGLPPDGSAHGPGLDQLIGVIHWLMLVLFVGWGIFYVFTLIRFRRSKNPTASYTGVKSHLSSYLEVGVLVVEVILLVGFSIPLWSKRVDRFPSEQEATVVRIVGEQFSWNVHYPGPDGKFGASSINLIDSDNPLGLDRSDPDAKDDIATINQFNVPVNKPVIIYLTTKDVIHSLSLPPYRVKQDAIPGMSIPVWFTPVKTTDEIREELKHPYSLTQASHQIRTLVLPAGTAVELKKGMKRDDMMLMADFPDTSGGMMLASGDHLTEENIGKLVDAGKTVAPARPAANLDKYVAMQDAKDKEGNVVVTRNEMLTEDAVTKLVAAGMHEIPGRQSSNMETFVVMQAYADQSGNSLAQKGDALTEELITKLSEAGLKDIMLAPATPTEIACAQLCGLGHYKMRGFMTVQTPEEYKKWFDEQEAAINPPSAPDTTSPTASIPSVQNQTP